MIDSLAGLRAAVRAGQGFRYVFFWSHQRAADVRVTAACQSQWWPCAFTLDGTPYTSTGQWMMACKARLFGDEATLAAILATDDPALIKKLGRAVRGFDEARWRSTCFDLVTRGNAAKFSQDPGLKEFLLGTSDAVPVEASPFDAVWGIGLGASDEGAMSRRSRPARRWGWCLALAIGATGCGARTGLRVPPESGDAGGAEDTGARGDGAVGLDARGSAVAALPDASAAIDMGGVIGGDGGVGPDGRVGVDAGGEANTFCVGRGCEVACGGAGVCGIDCESGGRCGLRCGDAPACVAVCESGSSCQVDCGTAACAVTCQMGASCRCTAAGCQLNCVGGTARACAGGGLGCRASGC